jgi:hypothetical protein
MLSIGTRRYTEQRIAVGKEVIVTLRGHDIALLEDFEVVLHCFVVQI